MASTARPSTNSETDQPVRWHEVQTPDGEPRPLYRKLLQDFSDLGAPELRTLGERMEATLREMGVTFDIIRNDPWGRQPWTCDLLPQVFSAEDWTRIAAGFQQRLRAFEHFLADVYGPREILRSGAVPIQVVLASAHYQNAAVGVPRPRGSFLHLSGMCVTRDSRGHWLVKNHHFSHAAGISYMMQNRRALARVVPEIFQDASVQSLAETPLAILERLREGAAQFGGDPTVVLLSPGPQSAVASELSFLARRMGIPVVEGGDLLVLNDCVYLKTVRGLERVEVIYNRIADAWLDPLVFRPDSVLGVPGLVHCLRKGTVALVNAVGAQLADDRSLLAFSSQIIRFYLNESPILPSVTTYWLGDIDQRELVIDNLAEWRVQPIGRDNRSASWLREKPSDEATLRAEIRKTPGRFVAQHRDDGVRTLCFEEGKRVDHPQDHIVYAIRAGNEFDVFPGALTRVHSRGEARGEFGFGWTSKDSWVPANVPQMSRTPTRAPELTLASRQVTSRVAESFYWLGRYLERAHHQAYLIGIVETLETEELNSAERKLYRPMWNRLLPPLEKTAGSSRRSIANRRDRYRLVLAPEPGSVVSTFQRAMFNAEQMQDSLSPEAWSTLTEMRMRFQRSRYREELSEAGAVRLTRRLSEAVTRLIPQFFATAENTMLADDGWRFCEIGQFLERATITANSVVAIGKSFAVHSERDPSAQATEIQLSAFLRLLASRDAYRRIYQMRAEPLLVLELLWQHPQVPRSVLRCLQACAARLRESISPEMLEGAGAAGAIDALIHRITRIDWHSYVHAAEDEDRPVENGFPSADARTDELVPLLRRLLDGTLEIHTLIADSFLNHQARIAVVSQPLFHGF
jgi:uncharacterized circularly permuted ATP-grasp superfamily protein/uncharacterized alpha-E superfamily protein